MERLFTDRFGSESRIRLWLESLADIALSAPKEHCHILGADLRYSSRIFAKSPGFTLIAVLVIALGIGATTAVFSLVNAVLLRSFPYGNAQDLAYLFSPNSQWRGQMIPDELPPNTPDFYDWQRSSHSFSSLTMLRQRMSKVVRAGSVKRVGSALVIASFFQMMEVKPELGRIIDAGPRKRGCHQRPAVA